MEKLDRKKLEEEFKEMVKGEFEAWGSWEQRQQINNRSIEMAISTLGDLVEKLRGDFDMEDMAHALALCGGVLVAIQDTGASLLEEQRKVMTNLSGLFDCVETETAREDAIDKVTSK